MEISADKISDVKKNSDLQQTKTTQPQKMNWNAKSVFAAMDKNKDGVVSDEEAQKFGFTFMKGQSLNQADFEKFFNTQQEKLSQNSTSLADFKSCFDKAEGGVIKDVPLTQAQQQELLKRIEMYEVYKSTLSDKEKAELEKNKHAQLDFAQFMDDGPIPDDYEYPSFYTKAHIDALKKRNSRLYLRDPKVRQYKQYFGKNGKYEQITNALKEGKLSKISNEDLGIILNHTDTTDLAQDGKIGSFTQGATGDCWFLSQLNNYASTKNGADNLAKRIKNNGNGTYTVTLQNPYEQSKTIKYNISDKELENFDISQEGNDYSAGDKDVRIYEIATSKLLQEYLPDTEENRNAGIAGGDPIKRVLVHKALGYKSDIAYFTKGKTLTNSTVNPPKQHKPQDYDFKADDEIYKINCQLVRDENGKAKVEPKIKTTGYHSFTELTAKTNIKPSEAVCGTSIKDYEGTEKDKRYIGGGHVYNFGGITNGNVTVNDPYLSAFPHTITTKDFEKYYGSMTYLPDNN